MCRAIVLFRDTGVGGEEVAPRGDNVRLGSSCLGTPARPGAYCKEQVLGLDPGEGGDERRRGGGPLRR